MRCYFLLAVAMASGLVLAASRSVTYAADLQPFAFVGHTIGDPFSKHSKDFKRDCSKDQFSMRSCRDDNSLEMQGNIQYIGSIPIYHLFWTYIDDKLAGFTLVVTEKAYGEIVAMISDKYGPPSKRDFGSAWEFPYGTLNFVQHDEDDYRKSRLDFKDKDLHEVLYSRVRTYRKEQGKKLF